MRVQTVMMAPDTEQYAGDGQPPASVPTLAAAARAAEEVGFDGVTMPEAGHDPFLPLAIAAEHTERITLATNVAIAFPRSPMVTAQLAWDLQQFSGGRFQLGLGTQVRGHVERRYASTWTGAPGPRLREYVQCVQAMFDTFQTGAPPSFEGEEYHFSLMNPFFNPGPIDHPHVPIHLAAVNPYMARLSGELCDGLRLHPIATFGYTRQVVLPAIRSGAERAGRSHDDVEVIGAPFLAIGETDEALERARAALKQQIAFYSSTRTYHAVLDHHGWTEVGLRLHEMSKEGRWKEMPSCITDEMLDEWAIIATPGDLVSKVIDRCGDLYPTIMLDIPSWLRQDRDWIAESVRALHGS
jgi:probable F420-dependent oxidoreductase